MQQNHPPGCLTNNRNIVLCDDNPVPGRPLTSLAGYGILYGISVSWLTAADAQGANCEAPERAGADRRQHPCERTRCQQRYAATGVYDLSRLWLDMAFVMVSPFRG